MVENSILEKDIESVIADKDLFLKLNNATVLITGATGLIGSMLVRILHAANERYDLHTSIYGQIRNKDKAGSLFGSLFSAIHFPQLLPSFL